MTGTGFVRRSTAALLLLAPLVLGLWTATALGQAGTPVPTLPTVTAAAPTPPVPPPPTVTAPKPPTPTVPAPPKPAVPAPPKPPTPTLPAAPKPPAPAVPAPSAPKPSTPATPKAPAPPVSAPKPGSPGSPGAAPAPRPVPAVAAPAAGTPGLPAAASVSRSSSAQAAAAPSGSVGSLPSFAPVEYGRPSGASPGGGPADGAGASATGAPDGSASERQALTRRRAGAAERVRGTRAVRPVPARFENRGAQRRSTVLVFWLERPGRVVFTVLDVSDRCRRVSTFAYRGRQGVNRVRYRGRVDGKPLPAGRYTLVPRVYSGTRVTALERVTIQILRPGADVPLWKRAALLPAECLDGTVSSLRGTGAFARLAGSKSAFARGGSGAGGDSVPGGAAGGVKGAEATNPDDADVEAPAVDEEPDDALGGVLALPAPFGDGEDGPPPAVAVAVLTGLGLAIMTLIVLLVRYVRGSWNP